ncbi:MAG: hypothetical protein WC796_04540 [Candidatus Pacearchaeota archaeon]|jgi:hypothetical protein
MRRSPRGPRRIERIIAFMLSRDRSLKKLEKDITDVRGNTYLIETPVYDRGVVRIIGPNDIDLYSGPCLDVPDVETPKAQLMFGAKAGNPHATVYGVYFHVGCLKGDGLSLWDSFWFDELSSAGLYQAFVSSKGKLPWDDLLRFNPQYGSDMPLFDLSVREVQKTLKKS